MLFSHSKYDIKGNVACGEEYVDYYQHLAAKRVRQKETNIRGMNTYPGTNVIGFTETALLSSMVMVERRVRNSCLVVSSLKQRYGYG